MPGRSAAVAGEAHKGTSHFSPVRTLLPYLWPEGRFDLKARIVLAMVALVLAKIATLAFPLFYGMAVDALSPKSPAVQAVG
ncbi:MAG: metal ABC transporter permease, partial [Micropepsaceae bacterium]